VRNVIAVLRRELRAYFYSPLAYVIIAAFLVLSGYFFYTDVVMFNVFNMGYTSLTRGIWQVFFNDLRFLLMMVIPLFTMRLFAEERKLGTIELLFTYPLRDVEILLGKYGACLSVLVCIIVLTFLYPALVGIIWGWKETPVLAASYLGLFLLGCAFIACGTFISSLTENQIVAAAGTYGVLILFWFLTWNEAVAGPQLIEVLLRVSLFDRFYEFAQGVVETKDVVFFMAFTGYFLFLTARSLESRKWRGR